MIFLKSPKLLKALCVEGGKFIIPDLLCQFGVRLCQSRQRHNDTSRNKENKLQDCSRF